MRRARYGFGRLVGLLACLFASGCGQMMSSLDGYWAGDLTPERKVSDEDARDVRVVLSGAGEPVSSLALRGMRYVEYHPGGVSRDDIEVDLREVDGGRGILVGLTRRKYGDVPSIERVGMGLSAEDLRAIDPKGWKSASQEVTYEGVLVRDGLGDEVVQSLLSLVRGSRRVNRRHRIEMVYKSPNVIQVWSEGRMKEIPADSADYVVQTLDPRSSAVEQIVYVHGKDGRWTIVDVGDDMMVH